jgi:hypothetical protein
MQHHGDESTSEVKNCAYLFDRFPPGSARRDSRTAQEWSQNLGKSREQATSLLSLPALNGKELYCAAMTADGSICAFGGHGKHDSTEISQQADADPGDSQDNHNPADGSANQKNLQENGVNLFVYDILQGHPKPVPLTGLMENIRHLSERVNGVALSRDGDILAAGSFSGAVALFYRNQREQRRQEEYKLVRVLPPDLEQVQ